MFLSSHGGPRPSSRLGRLLSKLRPGVPSVESPPAAPAGRDSYSSYPHALKAGQGSQGSERTQRPQRLDGAHLRKAQGVGHQADQ